MTIASILKNKGNEVIHVEPWTKVWDVTKLLTDRGIGAVMVLDDHGTVFGIVSERDILRCIAKHGAYIMDMRADQLMTSELKVASLKTTITEALQMMTDGRFRHLPIMEDGALLGIVSIGDLVKWRLMEQEVAVESLSGYITGKAYSYSA
jgi:CBS domain-containing protein